MACQGEIEEVMYFVGEGRLEVRLYRDVMLSPRATADGPEGSEEDELRTPPGFPTAVAADGSTVAADGHSRRGSGTGAGFGACIGAGIGAGTGVGAGIGAVKIGGSSGGVGGGASVGSRLGDIAEGDAFGEFVSSTPQVLFDCDGSCIILWALPIYICHCKSHK